MKIFRALASGFCRTLNLWKGILFLWLCSLMTVSLAVKPVKGFLKAAFGGSMITERLRDGLDVEVFGDLGTGFMNIMTAFPGILLLLIFTGLLLNSFLRGGIFDNLKSSSGKFTASNFFQACARNFWSFLLINLIISIIFLVVSYAIAALPISLAMQSESEKTPFIVVISSISALTLVSMIFSLVADYSRAWQATRQSPESFRALGFGFSRTFQTFRSSFPVMFILIIIQLAYVLLVTSIIGRWKPVTGGSVLALFLCSQGLVFVRTGLKVWRYAAVTALMEMHDTEKTQIAT